jgi:hypothetical protein
MRNAQSLTVSVGILMLGKPYDCSTITTYVTE